MQSLNPSSNQLYFPTSSNFAGGVVYPSSYLLPGLQNRPVALSRRCLYPTLSPSWSSSFFHHFPTCFFIDFASILAPKMIPKSSKIQSNIYLKTCSEKSLLLGLIFHRFFVDLGPSFTSKTVKNRWRVAFFMFSPVLLQDRFQHVFGIVFA